MESQTVGHKYVRGSVSGVIEDCAVRAVLLTGERASKTNMTEEMCAYETRDGPRNSNLVRMISSCVELSLHDGKRSLFPYNLSTGCPAVDDTTLIAHISLMPGPIIKPFDSMKVKTG